MNALVGYDSSDEEEDQVSPQRPTKIPKLDNNPPDHLTAPLKTPTAHPEAHIETQPLKASTINPPTPPPPAEDVPLRPATIPDGPAPGPTAPGPTLDETAAASDSPPFSPHTYTRQRLRELTMPPVPNFEIPDAPAAPSQNSEEAATLAATTKQFERFLELKKQGVHFNERLQTSSSLRNPSLLPKLLAFAGFEGQEECYESSLPEGLAVPARWPEDCYVESLVKSNERRERRRLAEREGLDFVPARQAEEGGVVLETNGVGVRKSKFRS